MHQSTITVSESNCLLKPYSVDLNQKWITLDSTLRRLCCLFIIGARGCLCAVPLLRLSSSSPK
jgi:hypothetical protein